MSKLKIRKGISRRVLSEKEKSAFLLKHYALLYRTTSSTLKDVSQAMLEICDNNCSGDESTGIPPCPLYAMPDVDGITGCHIPGGCRISTTAQGDSYGQFR